MLITGLIMSCNNKQAEALALQQKLMYKLQGASQLATVEYVLNKVVKGKKESTFFGFPIGESDFLAETEVRVKAGIDLNKLRPEDVQIQDKEVYIRLPKVEILNFSYPAEKLKVNEEFTRNSYFSELTADDIDKFMQEADMAIRKDIQWLGIEKAAEEKTRKFIIRFLQQAGYGPVHITFEEQSRDR